MAATKSLWTEEEQPIFNAWEALTPIDKFYQHEPRYEEWYRDLSAQDDAYRHSMILLIALNRYALNPTLPRCLTRDARSAYTPSPPARRHQPLQKFDEMRAAVGEIRGRRWAVTI